MTLPQLIKWIEHPELLDRESLYELRTLMARYPYFQSLRLLYLKNLYVLHDDAFGEELRKSVLYIADRSVLFYQIEGARYALQPRQPLKSKHSEAGGEAGEDRTLYLIDSFLSTVPDDQMQTSELDYAMDYTSFLLQSDDTALLPADEEELDAPKLRGQDLIDGFLNRSAEPDDEPLEELVCEPLEERAGEEKPAVEELPLLEEAESAEKTEVEVEESIEEDAELESEIPVEEETFTETLAKIYIKQHRYDKALEIIKKLSLNYPKKNAYFADQIRFLEKLIINAKSK